MAHFGAYDTSNTTTGNTPLAANAEIILGPLQTDAAQRIAGSVFADQPGTLHIEQSFDNQFWDVSATYSVTANAGQGFEEDIIAPNVRIRYTNGGSNQGVLRLFTRTFTTGR